MVKSKPSKKKPVFHGLKITITMEARTPEMLDWAMLQGIKCATEQYYGIAFHHKDDPTARVTCSTVKLRKRKSNGLPK